MCLQKLQMPLQKQTRVRTRHSTATTQTTNYNTQHHVISPAKKRGHLGQFMWLYFPLKNMDTSDASESLCVKRDSALVWICTVVTLSVRRCHFTLGPKMFVWSNTSHIHAHGFDTQASMTCNSVGCVEVFIWTRVRRGKCDFVSEYWYSSVLCVSWMWKLSVLWIIWQLCSSVWTWQWIGFSFAVKWEKTDEKIQVTCVFKLQFHNSKSVWQWNGDQEKYGFTVAVKSTFSNQPIRALGFIVWDSLFRLDDKSCSFAWSEMMRKQANLSLPVWIYVFVHELSRFWCAGLFQLNLDVWLCFGHWETVRHWPVQKSEEGWGDKK